MKGFGERFRELRESMRPRISQNVLADRIGMARTNLSKIETGRIQLPTEETQRRLAEGLGMSWDEFSAAMDLESLPKEPEPHVFVRVADLGQLAARGRSRVEADLSVAEGRPTYDIDWNDPVMKVVMSKAGKMTPAQLKRLIKIMEAIDDDDDE